MLLDVLRDQFDMNEAIHESIERYGSLYVPPQYVCFISRMESRFSQEDIFIRDDLILMNASVTH